jgi:hypothetical protein
MSKLGASIVKAPVKLTNKRVAKTILVVTFCICIFLSLKINLVVADGNTALSSESYKNSAYGFSINPPENWEKASQTSYVVEFFAPNGKNWNTTCYFSVWATEANMSLDDYFNYQLGERQSLGQFRLVSQNNLSIAGYPSRQLVYNCSAAGLDFENKDVYFVGNGRGFMVVYVAVPQVFEEYLPSFEQSLQTFKIISSQNQTPMPSVPEFPSVTFLSLIAVLTLGALLQRRKIKKSA